MAEAQQAWVSAETRAEEAPKNLQEQKTLLGQARQDLVEIFQALSGEAMRQNDETFLNLAKTSFETLQAEAKGKLAQRQQAIHELVRPFQGALDATKSSSTRSNNPASRPMAGWTSISTPGRIPAAAPVETDHLVRALQAPTVRGRWGEMPPKRVAKRTGKVIHRDFIEQDTVSSKQGRPRPDMVAHLPGGRQIVVDARRCSAYLEVPEAPDDP